MSQKKVLLAINHIPSDIIIKTLNANLDSQTDFIYITSTGHKGIPLLKRHLTYFILACKVMFRRNRYDYIIFWQQFIGIYYVLLSIFFIRKTKPRHVLLTFIFLERQGLVGKIHRFLYNKTVSSPLVNEIVCHSSLEKKYYINMFGNPGKFHFIPIGTREPIDESEKIQFQDFYFAAGRSNRDYKTLIEAFRGMDKKLIIACVPQNVEGIDIPPNVKVYFDVYNDDYLNYLQNAKAIVIPIKNTDVSAGQLVLVEAMRYGKAAIVTRGPCMDDYDGADNILFVAPHKKDDIVKAVDLLEHEEGLVQSMGLKAQQFFNKNYTLKNYVQGISESMKF